MMSILDTLKDRSIAWRGNPPAEEKAIQTLLNQSRIDLPEDYLNVLRYSNGGDGTFGAEPEQAMDFEIWPAEEVLQANRDLRAEELLPGFFMFGGDRANELLAFNTNELKPWKVYMVPMIVMSKEDAIVLAHDFASFMKSLSQDPINA